MNMNNLFSLKFWFNTRPNALSGNSQEIFLIFTAILIALCIISGIAKARGKKSPYGKIRNSVYAFFAANSIISLLLLFFTYELVPFLSARFWFILWAAGMITWLVFIGKKLAAIPGMQKELEREKEFKKYIP